MLQSCCVRYRCKFKFDIRRYSVSWRRYLFRMSMSMSMSMNDARYVKVCHVFSRRKNVHPPRLSSLYVKYIIRTTESIKSKKLARTHHRVSPSPFQEKCGVIKKRLPPVPRGKFVLLEQGGTPALNGASSQRTTFSRGADAEWCK